MVNCCEAGAAVATFSRGELLARWQAAKQRHDEVIDSDKFPCVASQRFTMPADPHYSARTRDPGEISRGPGVLEIEAAGDAIDVEDFTGEMQPCAFPTFHGLEVDL